MASRDQEDDFGGGYTGSNSSRRPGDKRTFEDLDDDGDEEDDVFGNVKGKNKSEDSAPGVKTGMILSLRESLKEYELKLSNCQTELEAEKSELQKWLSAFQMEPVAPAGAAPEPTQVVSYLRNLKSSEDSLKEQLEKSKKREAALLAVFAKKEQEISDLKSALRDLKTQLKPPSMQGRRLLLDPAIHEEFTRLKTLTEEKEKKIKELEENAKAVVFTPQSKMGKMLMAKCRTLQEENEEIGEMASEGKIHELSMKLALQKSQYGELKSQFEALYKQIEGLTNDVDRSNELVFVLQERLEGKDSEIYRLKQELFKREQEENGLDKDQGGTVELQEISV